MPLLCLKGSDATRSGNCIHHAARFATSGLFMSPIDNNLIRRTPGNICSPSQIYQHQHMSSWGPKMAKHWGRTAKIFYAVKLLINF